VCAPLIAKGKSIGVIELLNKRQGLFTSHDVQLLESVAAQTASAIENARLHEATQHELNERIQAERRLQTLIDAAPDLIYLKDRNLRYLLVNQAFAAYWGLESHDIVGQVDADFMPEEMARANRVSDLQIFGECQVIIEEQEEGERVTETRKAPVLDTTGQAAGIVGIIRDITERKRLQEQLILEQKEQSMLTLAGGIAHDFNNALVGIVGNIDLLRMDLPRSPEIEHTLRSMERSAQRMVGLTEQLLAYAGSVKHQFQVADMNKLVKETISMMRGGFLPNIAVQQILADDLWPVEVNPTQVRQVLVNLITNACEAMVTQGGTLTIQTENVYREAWVCGRHHQHSAGEYVHLVVHDTGPGIDSQVQKRLFEPFFTTKFMGRGLGLAVAVGILRDHEGCIEIESHSGRGAAVHIYLPRTPLQASPDEPAIHADQQAATTFPDEP
jgi:two-component system cell cycle sensor histidine kinase/response regulator CckA